MLKDTSSVSKNCGYETHTAFLKFIIMIKIWRCQGDVWGQDISDTGLSGFSSIDNNTRRESACPRPDGAGYGYGSIHTGLIACYAPIIRISFSVAQVG